MVMLKTVSRFNRRASVHATPAWLNRSTYFSLQSNPGYDKKSVKIQQYRLVKTVSNVQTRGVHKALLSFACQPSNMALSLYSFLIDNMVCTEACAAVIDEQSVHEVVLLYSDMSSESAFLLQHP